MKNSSHNTSLSPYDDYVESEIKEDYKSRYSTRRWLLKGLTGYFLMIFWQNRCNSSDFSQGDTPPSFCQQLATKVAFLFTMVDILVSNVSFHGLFAHITYGPNVIAMRP